MTFVQLDQGFPFAAVNLYTGNNLTISLQFLPASIPNINTKSTIGSFELGWVQADENGLDQMFGLDQNSLDPNGLSSGIESIYIGLDWIWDDEIDEKCRWIMESHRGRIACTSSQSIWSEHFKINTGPSSHYFKYNFDKPWLATSKVFVRSLPNILKSRIDSSVGWYETKPHRCKYNE